jgi:hypothetical protein
MPKGNRAYLVGPFVGEVTWEFFRFAPYIIHLKKERPEIKVIVFTRPNRFDLYGQYADILVPLNIPNDKPENQHCFTIRNLSATTYSKLVDKFRKKYETRFEIVNHIYPDISYFYYKLKWQFPRGLMDYDFKPRKNNYRFINNYLKTDKNVLINFNFSEKFQLVKVIEKEKHFPVFMNMFSDDYLANKRSSCTFLGSLIELLKKCKVVVSDLNSHVAHLSLLVGTPVISSGESPSQDHLKLINPLSTQIIMSTDEYGIKEFFEREKNENNI